MITSNCKLKLKQGLIIENYRCFSNNRTKIYIFAGLNKSGKTDKSNGDTFKIRSGKNRG